MTRIVWYILILALVVGSFIAFRAANNSQQATIPLPEPMTSTSSSTVLPLNKTKQKIPEFQNWHEFAAPDNKFKVLLPVLPQHATENVNDPLSKGKRKYDMYVSEEDDGTVFMISSISHPEAKNATDKEMLLKQLMADMSNSNPKNKLLNSKTGVYQGYQSLDFSISNDEVHIDARAFVVDNSLIVLSSISKLQNYNPQEFAFFANSFELIK